MPLDEKETFATSNLKIALRYPSSMIRFLVGGRLGAYREIVTRILSTLADTSDAEIHNLLNECMRSQRIVFPRTIGIFDESIGLVPQVALYYLVRCYRPAMVVETGVWAGRSTWFILNALEQNDHGTLYSIDLGATRLIEDGKVVQTLPTKGIGGLVPTSLRHRWELTFGDSGRLLPEIVRRLPRVDLFLHDSNHAYGHMLSEFETVWPRLTEGGFLCSDDVGTNRAWQDFLSRVRHSGVIVQSRFGICRKGSRDSS